MFITERYVDGRAIEIISDSVDYREMSEEFLLENYRRILYSLDVMDIKRYSYFDEELDDPLLDFICRKSRKILKYEYMFWNIDFAMVENQYFDMFPVYSKMEVKNLERNNNYF